jgi:mono/diheme cytochrome c family protein
VNGRWALAALLVAALCGSGPARAQTTFTPSTDPVAGAQLFRTIGCERCHGGDVERFRRSPRSLPALAAAMWNHGPQMAGRIRDSDARRPYVTANQMSDLVAFLYGADVVRGDARLTGRRGDATRGERVVTDKGCLACHSIRRPGGRRAGSLDSLKGLESPWTVVAQMWNHVFLMDLETSAQGRAWTKLTADEMADLTAFLESLMRTR